MSQSGPRKLAAAFALAALLAAAPALAALAAAACPAPPPPQRDVEGMGYYTDAASSVIDPALKKRSEEMAAPYNFMQRQLALMTDRALADHDEAAGRCAVSWIETWARGEAMLGEMRHINNDQADYTRQWTLGAIAIAYAKVQGLATDAQRAVINPWLIRLADASLAYWNDRRHKRNNHYYWTGLGLMATSVGTGDQRILAEASTIYTKAINDIQDDGSLPLELARGIMAQHYHNFALEPLVVMAELARSQKLDWYGLRDHRLERLARLVAAGFADPAFFVARTGKPQRPQTPNAETAWVGFYVHHVQDPSFLADLMQHTATFDPRIGGDTVVMANAHAFDPK